MKCRDAISEEPRLSRFETGSDFRKDLERVSQRDEITAGLVMDQIIDAMMVIDVAEFLRGLEEISSEPLH